MSFLRAGCFLVGCLSFALFARADEEPPCCGKGKDEAKPSQSAAKDAKDPPPCGCPLARIADMGGGIWLFEATYFETSCSDEPELIEMYGPYNLPLSPYCDINCTAAKRKQRKEVCHEPVYFPGLEDYVAHDTEDELYEPYNGENSRLMVDPKMPYIRFQPDATSEEIRYAKVFVHALDLAKVFGDPKLHRHLMYLAKEVETAPPAGTPMPLVTTEPLQSDAVCQGKECHLFRVRCAEQKPVVQMLLLTVKE